MTQTQTTADRIQAIIEAGLFDFNARPSCEVIAAEIDALTQTNALMLESAERGQATVAELRAQIDALTAERDAARESLGYVQAETDAMYRRVVILEAEVERLRLAAEAWEAQENSANIFMRHLRGHVSFEDTIKPEADARAAAARARAAKEAKP